MWEVLGRESLMISCKKTELYDRITPWDSCQSEEAAVWRLPPSSRDVTSRTSHHRGAWREAA